MIPLSIQPEILKRGAGVGEGETVSVSPATTIVARQSASEKIRRCFINEASNQRSPASSASFEGFGTWIVDEPGPERLKMSILSEEDAPELREGPGSSWPDRRV